MRTIVVLLDQLVHMNLLPLLRSETPDQKITLDCCAQVVSRGGKIGLHNLGKFSAIPMRAIRDSMTVLPSRLHDSLLFSG